MAAIGVKNVGVKDVSRPASVPNSDVARVMYYLRCVTLSCGLDIIQDDLVDYNAYHRLSEDRADQVFVAGYKYSPDELLNKTIFLDSSGQICSQHSNIFLEITEATDILAVQREVLIRGKQTKVTKVMVFNEKWLQQMYLDPMVRQTSRLHRSILRSQSSHCEHCAGKPGKCACSRCARRAGSECSPSLTMSGFLGALVEGLKDHEEKKAVADRSKPKMPPRTSPRAPAPETPKAPGRLPPKAATPEAPKARAPAGEYSSGTRRKPSPAAGQFSGFFYKDMSARALKKYLDENGVSHRDCIELEDIRRRAWECFCENMSGAELVSFMLENGIDGSMCRSAAERREKLKGEFRPEARPVQPDGTSTFREGQHVCLQGLKRAEMNGERGTIVDIGTVSGRAKVQLDMGGNPMLVKYENLVVDGEFLD